MGRSLPGRDVTPINITEAYIAFILYCNSQFPLDVDTSQLRAKFNGVPRSDNKDFDTYYLFNLIKKFTAKEIETWGQLALELGVEPPDVTKNQSIQKVQQYTVRLKRWMRAMHIDAFFEYLQGRQHVYFTNIPPPDDPYPATGRDGVAAEEDLAIRALEPSFRPKRGRRRNSETEREEDSGSKEQPQVPGTTHVDERPASAYPQSAIPMSAHPNANHDPWTAATAVSAHSFAPWQASQYTSNSAITPSIRWPSQALNTLASPHPMSAHPGGSMASQLEAAYADEPSSAVTPASRKRRRHGPAVSSAWPSSNPSGSKPRGRPPASRNTQDGPFSTFPVQSAVERSNQSSSPLAFSKPLTASADSMEAGSSAMPPPSMTGPTNGQGKPARLSLQVPQHKGGPVRLATPPTVIISEETNRGEREASSISHTPETTSGAQHPRQAPTSNTTNIETPPFNYEALKRALASDLLRAEISGRVQRLAGDEAKRLAGVILERMNISRAETQATHDDTACLTAASWLGLGEQLNVPFGPAVGQTKKLRITRFLTDSEGYEQIVPADAEVEDSVREVFDLLWTVTQGTCRGTFELTSLTLPDPSTPAPEDDIHNLIMARVREAARQIGGLDERAVAARAKRSVPRWQHAMRQDAGLSDDDLRGGDGGDDGVDWKTKYRMLEFGMSIARGEFERARATMLEKVLDVLI